MIKHDLKLDGELWIDGTRITLKRKSGQVASLVIDAPSDVVIKTTKSDREQKEGTAPQEAV